MPSGLITVDSEWLPGAVDQSSISIHSLAIVCLYIQFLIIKLSSHVLTYLSKEHPHPIFICTFSLAVGQEQVLQQPVPAKVPPLVLGIVAKQGASSSESRAAV